MRSTRRSTAGEGGFTTTVSAELDRPPKLRSIVSRAATDSEPSACHPAPESACSTRGAKAARTIATTAQVTKMARA